MKPGDIVKFNQDYGTEGVGGEQLFAKAGDGPFLVTAIENSPDGPWGLAILIPNPTRMRRFGVYVRRLDVIDKADL